MHDPLLVEVCESRPKPFDPVAPDALGNGDVELPCLRRRLREVPPFHVLHREEVSVSFQAEIEDLDQVGVGKGGGETGLAGELFAEARVLRMAGVNHLQGDPLPEPPLPRETAQVHLRHAAGGDPSQDAVFPEPGRDQIPHLPSSTHSIPCGLAGNSSSKTAPRGVLSLIRTAPP